jgi:hypothetical protein
MQSYFARILHLLRCNPKDLAAWDMSGAAAKRSFLLMLPVLPVYFLSFDTLARDHFAALPLFTLMPLLGADYVLEWVTFPLAIALLLRLIRMKRAPFPAFVIITNHLSVLNASALIPLLLLARFNIVSEDMFYGLMNILFMVTGILISRWAMLLWETSLGFAALVFLANSLTSQFVGLTTLTLLKNYLAS